jgi:hypothetical protein
VGDEADAAGPAKELPAAPAQVPDAVPAVLPPSNSKVEFDVPALDVPMPDIIPIGEGPGVMPIAPTCAKAEPQPKRTAVIAIINKRVIAGFSSSCFGVYRAPSGKYLDNRTKPQ